MSIRTGTALTAAALLGAIAAQGQERRVQRPDGPQPLRRVQVVDTAEPAPEVPRALVGPSAAPPRTAPPEVYTPGAPPPPWAYAPFGYAPHGGYAPYSGYGYSGYGAYGTRFGSRYNNAYSSGRRAEQWRQDADEGRRAVEARRRQRARTGKDRVVERPGPYPYNPGPGHGVYGGYAQPYGYGGYGYGGYGYDPYYYGSRLEGYRQDALAAREELTLMAYEDLLTQGLLSFRAGQYGHAARSWIASARKHQGDSGSRIHAAQALVAVGIYDDALAHVRRAVSLKPLLLYTAINLQADYGDKADFDKHVAALEAAARKQPNQTDLWLLLAWERLFSPHPERCVEAVRNIQRIVPHDRLAERITRAAKPIIAGAQ